jgi:class 3 adenylate cyclase
MFTDLVNSTEMTGRLGDHRAVEMVRAHDHFVRVALADHGGREVKHTGDGIMAAFGDSEQALNGCCAIMRAIDHFNQGRDEPLCLRIGLHVGEPVQDSNDLFGSTVQMAARICADAAVDSVVISDAVRALVNSRFSLTALGRRVLKGFREPVYLYSVDWRTERPTVAQ